METGTAEGEKPVHQLLVRDVVGDDRCDLFYQAAIRDGSIDRALEEKYLFWRVPSLFGYNGRGDCDHGLACRQYYWHDTYHE